MNMLLPKAQIVRDRKYLDYLQNQPCIVTKKRDVEPAHLRLLGSGGMSLKPSDARALPLYWELHREQDNKNGEGMFWVRMANEHPMFLWEMLIEVAEQRYERWKR